VRERERERACTYRLSSRIRARALRHAA